MNEFWGKACDAANARLTIERAALTAARQELEAVQGELEQTADELANRVDTLTVELNEQTARAALLDEALMKSQTELAVMRELMQNQPAQPAFPHRFSKSNRRQSMTPQKQ